MQFRHARLGAPEAVGITEILFQQSRADINTPLIASRHRIGALRNAVQAELWKRRRFPLLVGINLNVRPMIDGDQVDLVKIGNLAQLLSDAYLQVARCIPLQRLTRNLDVLVMVDWKKAAITRHRTQWSHAQHIRNKLKTRPIPSPNHRAGPRKPLRFFVRICLVGGLLHFVLNQPIRPGNPHRIGHRAPAQIEQNRVAWVDLLLVQSAGLDLDFGSLCKFHILDAGESNANPVGRQFARQEVIVAKIGIGESLSGANRKALALLIDQRWSAIQHNIQIAVAIDIRHRSDRCAGR